MRGKYINEILHYITTTQHGNIALKHNISEPEINHQTKRDQAR